MSAPPARVRGKERCPAKMVRSFEIKVQTRVLDNGDWLAPWADCLRHLPSRRAYPPDCRKDIIQSKGAKVLRDSPMFYLISVLHKKYVLMCTGCSAFAVSFVLSDHVRATAEVRRAGYQYKVQYIGSALRHPDPQVVISAHTLPIGSHLRARLSHVSSTQYIGSSDTHARHGDLSGWRAERHPLAIYQPFIIRDVRIQPQY
jgi:hypothetical protein